MWVPAQSWSVPRLPLTACARLLLAGHEAVSSVAITDAVCGQLHQSASPFALLQVHAALISNINVRENLLLTSTWSLVRDAAQTSKQLEAMVADWGLSRDTMDRLLQRRPAQLTDNELRLVVLMRAALVQPRVLLLLPDWFGHPPSDEEPWWVLQRQHFGQCAWCFVCDQRGVEPLSENWQRILL